MLDDADMRFAVDDARVRHKGLAELIYFVDGQAIKLLSLYVTIGLAASAAAIAGFSSTAPIPNAASVGLCAAVVLLFIGSCFCFIAMMLESRLKCPRCGSRKVRVAFSVPPATQQMQA